MRKRVVTGVVGGAFIAYVTYLGGSIYDFVYFGITCIAIFEISRLFFKSGFDYGGLLNYFFAASLFYIKITNNLYYFKLGSYVVFFMYHMILMNGSKYVWLVYIIAFGSDTFAYFTGKMFGRTKLYPQVSPNKTIEGAIGGIIGCTIISILYFNYLSINKYIYIIIFSICASIFSLEIYLLLK
jgi:phosphatidate cytidylyltransferase